MILLVFCVSSFAPLIYYCHYWLVTFGYAFIRSIHV